MFGYTLYILLFIVAALCLIPGSILVIVGGVLFGPVAGTLISLVAATVASALSWPLGEGKERILILPCPDDMETLRADIASHDIVVLMKIGARLGAVLGLLDEMGIARHCAFARRIGLPGEVLCDDVRGLSANASGYLATMLIRRTAREKRHA